MSIDTSVAEFLSGGGAKSAKFENIGDKLIGKVSAAKQTQQTDIDGTPKTWDNGDPRMQLVVTVAGSNQRDPSDENDEGDRNMYVKGSKSDPTTSAGSLVAALREAGVSTLEAGADIAWEFIGLGEPKKVGLSKPKQYRCQYRPPALAAGADLFGQDQQQAPATPAPASPAAQSAPAQAAPAVPLADMFAV